MIFDGIILDVDGTIWNTTQIVADAWNKAIDNNFPQVPHVTAEILKGQFGKTMDVIGNNLFGMLGDENRALLLENAVKQSSLQLMKTRRILPTKV